VVWEVEAVPERLPLYAGKAGREKEEKGDNARATNAGRWVKATLTSAPYKP
jgi:hypothetical protein